MNKPAPMIWTPTFDDFMNNTVAKLPQAQHIKEEDAKVWYDSVRKNDPERFEWHTKRLTGLGGSDIGEIVANKMGEFNAFKTPYDIINDKLLRSPIEPHTNHTRFGSLMEDVTKAIFHEDFKCSSNTQLIQQITDHVSPRHPWLKSNPDDVVNIGGPGADPNVSGVLVVDYKNLSVVPSEPATTVKAQLIQYNYALEESGFTGPVARAAVYTDFGSKTVIAKPIDLDPEIVKHVLSGGDEAWNHVLNDTKPAFSIAVKSNINFSDESKEKLQQLEEQIAKVKVVVTAATNELDDLQKEFVDELKEQAGEKLIKGESLPVRLMSVTTRQTLNEPEVENLIQTQKLDPQDFKKDTKKLDEDRVIEALQEAGKNPNDYIKKTYDFDKIKSFCEENGFALPVKESISTNLRASKKSGLTKENLEEIHAHAAELVRSVAQDVSLDTSPNLTLAPK